MNKTVINMIFVLLCAAAVFAQKPVKDWKEWGKKDAQKILDDSAWALTQIETDTSEMFYSPTTITQTGSSGGDNGRGDQGATNQATSVKFRIRLFSARPIRQAYVRLMELSQGAGDEAASEKRHAWANLRSEDHIIVSVAYESNDRRYLGRVSQSFSSAIASVLKNSTYLERKDGKRVFLSDYVPPSKDPFGARFIFPRTIDGQPFITPDGGSLRFHSEYEDKTTLDSAMNPEGQTSRGATRQTNSSIRPQSPFKIKLDTKFKLADMVYNGELEY